MKIKIAIFVLLYGTLFNCQINLSKDCIEKEIVCSQLKIIEDFVQNDSLDIHVQRMGAISFLESLTKIISESDANFFGKMKPTKRDYQKWLAWYEINKETLCNANNKVIIDSIYKDVNPLDPYR